MLGWEKPAGGGTGSGDVVGPAGAINDDIVLFDGPSGKLIKDSGVKLSSLTGGGTGNGAAFPLPLDIRPDRIRRDIFPPGGVGFSNNNISNTINNYVSTAVPFPIPLDIRPDIIRRERFSPGGQGVIGPQGNKGGIQYNFSSSTVDSDPGPGFFRYDNAVFVNITQIFIDDLDAYGNDVSAFTQQIFGGASEIYIASNLNSDTTYNIFSVSGVIVGVGYIKLQVSWLSGSTLPVNNSRYAWFGTADGAQGNPGNDGAPGADGANGIPGRNGFDARQGNTTYQLMSPPRNDLRFANIFLSMGS